MPKKLYTVELVRTSFVTYTVEAQDSGDAEDEAWKLLARDGADNGDAEWDINYVGEYEE